MNHGFNKESLKAPWGIPKRMAAQGDFEEILHGINKELITRHKSDEGSVDVEQELHKIMQKVVFPPGSFIPFLVHAKQSGSILLFPEERKAMIKAKIQEEMDAEMAADQRWRQIV